VGQVTVILAVPGFALIAAAMTGMARMPLNPGRYAVRRSPQRPHAVLTARLPVTGAARQAVSGGRRPVH
jgi:hypothetical protein